MRSNKEIRELVIETFDSLISANKELIANGHSEHGVEHRLGQLVHVHLATLQMLGEIVERMPMTDD